MEQWQHNVLEAVRKTREISLPQFGCVDQIDFKNSDPQNVVTAVDREIEQVLKTEFQKVDSKVGFVGEEFGGEVTDAYWLVDPVDGTGLYTHGLPFCTTQVAKVENGQVMFGIVYDFVRDELYYASKGEGAFKDGDSIQVNDRDANQAYIGYENRIDEQDHYFDRYKRVKKKYRVMNFRNAGYEAILIARGQLEGRIVYGGYGQPHDFAASTFLVSEAGGVVANIGKSNYNLNEINHVIATPKLFVDLTEGADALFPITE